jgi:hypothetical protein
MENAATEIVNRIHKRDLRSHSPNAASSLVGVSITINAMGPLYLGL